MTTRTLTLTIAATLLLLAAALSALAPTSEPAPEPLRWSEIPVQVPGLVSA